MKKLMVANWKLHPQTYGEADKLAKAIANAARRRSNVETVLCPPFLWLGCLADEYAGKAVFGGQDAFWEERGAYTGEISPTMLKHVGCRWVIIGHSERRRHLGETDEMVNRKVRAALAAGLKVILCIGETLAERRRGHTSAVIRLQLKKDLAGVLRSKTRDLVIAYEPVWAIGTGLPETPENAEKTAKFIRNVVNMDVRVLYGGSVNADNLRGYLSMPHIAGALVGGASLRVSEFVKMLRIADSV